jgi:hypothetical protein
VKRPLWAVYADATKAATGEDREQRTSDVARRLEEGRQLLRLDPRPLGLRRLEAAAPPGRRAQVDVAVFDGRLEDLRHVPQRVVDRAVRKAALAEPLAAEVPLAVRAEPQRVHATSLAVVFGSEQCAGRRQLAMLRWIRETRPSDGLMSVGGRARTRERILRRAALIAGVLVLLALVFLISGHWILGIILAVAAAAAVLVFFQARGVR